MLKRDHLEKQVEQLGRVIARLIDDMLKLKRKGHYAAAFEEAARITKNELDLDMASLEEMEPELFLHELSVTKRTDASILELIASLLNTTALIAEESGDSARAINLYFKTYLLLNHVNQKDKTFSLKRQETIEKLKTTLSL